MTRPNHRSKEVTCLVALGCLVALCLGTAGAATAQLRTPEYQGLALTGDYQIRVDGELIKDAEVYRGARPPAFLILSPVLPAPTLLAPGQGTVATLNLMKLAKRSNGTIDVLPGATQALEGRFQMESDAVTFTVGGKNVRLEEKPPLLGLHGAEDLKDYSAIYEKGSASYTPNESTLSQLEGQSTAVRVRIFFGSWCPLCQRTVPHIVRVAEELESSKFDFEFYGLPRGFGEEPEARKFGVTGVPTGIVFVDGKEAGRIEGNSWLRPEQALKDILGKS